MAHARELLWCSELSIHLALPVLRKHIYVFQTEVSMLFLASESGRAGRALVLLILQVLRYCRA